MQQEQRNPTIMTHDSLSIHVSVVNAPKQKRIPSAENNKKIALVEKNPERLQHLRESLKRFELIKRNIYLERRKKKPTEDDIFICECRRAEDPSDAERREKADKSISINCGSRCLNKLMSTECDPNTCPCGDMCQNRRFQNHQDSFVYPFLTEGKGWGLASGEKIKAGSFVMQYIGEIFSLNSEEGQFRQNLYSKSACTYLMQISSMNNEVVDPTFKGNCARFINHSCEPNCVTQKWNVLGEVCVGIFSLRDIEEGEELTFDYQFESYKTALTKCLCGAPKCKKYLGYIPAQFSAEDWEERLENMPCQICGEISPEDETLLLCDNCNEGFHLYCLTPPLTELPQDAWFCTKCRETIENNNYRIADSQNKMRESMDKHRKDVAERNKKRRMYEEADQSEEEDYQKYNRPYQEYSEFYEYQKNLMKDDNLNLANVSPKSEDGKDNDGAGKQQDTGDMLPAIETGMDHHVVSFTRDENENTKVTQKDEYMKIRSQLMAAFVDKIRNNPDISKKLSEFENIADITGTEKRVFTINNIQLDVIRCNQSLFTRIGAKMFWDHGNIANDLYIKSRELNIFGTAKQLTFIENILIVVDELCDQYRGILGQIDAKFRVPALFLKRIIGHQHAIVHGLERRYCVSIQYDKRHVNDECYSRQHTSELKLKGMKENIIKACNEIKRIAEELAVKRIYLTRNEIKVILSNLNYIKREIFPTEFRINRDALIKELNHPFYYLTYKDREVAIVGTRDECEEAENIIRVLIEKDRVKNGPPFVQSHFLWPTGFRIHLSRVKKELESEFNKCKMIFYDAAPPRKNITISLIGPPNMIKPFKRWI